ncbi:hypothetical protein GCM10023317_19450 [Actinopolymorpha pittospori]
MVGEPAPGEAAQPSRLVPGHRLERGAETQPGAGLHLTDDQRVTVTGDDVDLAYLAASVAREDDEPGLLQMPDRELLAVASDQVFHVHGRSPPAPTLAGAGE